ncbi:MAG TPA: hypothetical protein VJ953_07685 [Saprospiraceae bacterium]|nr:hypothetical protein [Saprospiraceae bacterium]
MGKSLQAYYREAFEQLADLEQQSRARITTHFKKVLDTLIDFDEALTEELNLILIKNKWQKSDRAHTDGMVTTEAHSAVINQSVKAILKKLAWIKEQIRDKDLDLSLKDCEPTNPIRQYLEHTSPYARIQWIKKILQLSRCVGQLRNAQGEVIGSGLLIAGNTFLTTFRVLPNAEELESLQLRIDFLQADEAAPVYRLSPTSWKGDAELNIASVKVVEELSTWNMLPASPATVKSNQLLLALGAGSEETLTSLLAQSRLLQYQSIHLQGEEVDAELLPGTPVFDEQGNWLGIHYGGPLFQATTASAINDFLQGTNAEEEPAFAKKTEAETTAERASDFNKHHQYTCDRVEHYDRFTGYVDIENGLRQKDLHFFYLHGGELQSHIGLFKRFVAKLEGRDQDHISLPKSLKQVKDQIVIFPRSSRLENLKLELPVRVLKSFGLDEHQIEKISEKHLADILDYPNSTVYQWGAGEKICLLIEVSEAVWDKELTPEVATWFIEEFCQPGILKDSPEFFIFFAINYDDEEPDEIKTEVLEALKQGKYLEHLFPELDMVEGRDIKAWFAEYSVYWDHDRRAIRQTQKRHFPDLKELQYMIDVEDILADIIEEINNM